VHAKSAARNVTGGTDITGMALRWPEADRARAELAVCVACGTVEINEPSAAGTAAGGWTKKHAIACFFVHPRIRSWFSLLLV
jgi:hypothetical protein